MIANGASYHRVNSSWNLHYNEDEVFASLRSERRRLFDIFTKVNGVLSGEVIFDEVRTRVEMRDVVTYFVAKQKAYQATP